MLGSLLKQQEQQKQQLLIKTKVVSANCRKAKPAIEKCLPYDGTVRQAEIINGLQNRLVIAAGLSGPVLLFYPVSLNHHQQPTPASGLSAVLPVMSALRMRSGRQQ